MLKSQRNIFAKLIEAEGLTFSDFKFKQSGANSHGIKINRITYNKKSQLFFEVFPDKDNFSWGFYNYTQFNPSFTSAFSAPQKDTFSYEHSGVFTGFRRWLREVKKFQEDESLEDKWEANQAPRTLLEGHKGFSNRDKSKIRGILQIIEEELIKSNKVTQRQLEQLLEELKSISEKLDTLTKSDWKDAAKDTLQSVILNMSVDTNTGVKAINLLSNMIGGVQHLLGSG